MYKDELDALLKSVSITFDKIRYTFCIVGELPTIGKLSSKWLLIFERLSCVFWGELTLNFSAVFTAETKSLKTVQEIDREKLDKKFSKKKNKKEKENLN